MKRKITEDLEKWKNSSNRKPLILNGARQVGKSYILDEFGKENYESTIHVNLDINESVRKFFSNDITPKNIIQYLESAYNQRIEADKTLIILDEIQASKRALLSLKSFCELAPQYHVVAAGSLLGVAISHDEHEKSLEYSFPVGKVDELRMYPMDFEEYLWAVGKGLLAKSIREHYEANVPMPSATHDLALSLYKQYLIIGGMPEAVRTYVESQSLVLVGNIQSTVMDDYVADMAKYATPETAVKIRACYNSIPVQLAKENKKFQYKMVRNGAGSAYFGEAIDWLEQAGVVLRCRKIEQGFIPIKVYEDMSDFKLYMSDIGMLTMKSGMPAQLLLSPIQNDNTFSGSLTENYVAQALKSKGFPLYYWKNKNTAEVDFVIQKGADVIPVEVKTGIRVKAKSMMQFMETYHCSKAIRISQKNFGCENGIKSVPLYAVFCIENDR
jgi:predicted AAA+ superfamily ATPase